MAVASSSLIDQTESYRAQANRRLNPQTQAELGQFTTSKPIARFMASLFEDVVGKVTLLDPGAGAGSLTAAFIYQCMSSHAHPSEISVDAYEVDQVMVDYLEQTLHQCKTECERVGLPFSGNIVNRDFIDDGVDLVWKEGSLFGQPLRGYSHCIMNPPYKKILSTSKHRRSLSRIGIETSNLYSAFLALAIRLLAPGGELVAIVPRSFCNGVYFRPFRQLLLSEMAIKHLHVFDSRTQAFKENDVLQENIILHAVKQVAQGDVYITSSSDPSLTDMTQRLVTFNQVVKPEDAKFFIHIATSDLDQMIVDRIGLFTHSLDNLGLDVSTGPVVDFRLKDDIRAQPEAGTVPLIYPSHFCHNEIQWPLKNGKKPNAIHESAASRQWLMPNGWYVLTRRFSSKEEKRRVVAAICDPGKLPAATVGFENHINVIHDRKNGLDPLTAKGLAVYLNSTLIDLYFRQFSGHTQVNATDLRTLPYPSHEILSRLGAQVNSSFPGQIEIDALLEEELNRLSQESLTERNPMTIQQKMQESLEILDALGMPRGQRNERSALTLLALLNLKPGDSWANAGEPLIGITPIMDFVRDHYGRAYAPNTRETFRRQTVHQFMDAGMVIPNPDQPNRPVNSPKWVYQIEPALLKLLHTFGTSEWETSLEIYFTNRRPLAEKYARRREMEKVPLVFGEEQKLYLTPGKHSLLIRDIIEEFGPRFAPGAEVLYVGDTGDKLGHFEAAIFQELGLSFDNHGKFPDVVLYF